MITQDKRLLGGVAGAVLLAAVGGFSVARCTAEPAADTQSGEKAEEDAEAHADSLPMKVDAIRAADYAVKAIRAGVLGSGVIAQASVAAAQDGHRKTVVSGKSVSGRVTVGGRAGTQEKN